MLKTDFAHTTKNQPARIAKNFFLLLIANGADIIFGLVSVAIFARYLGVDVYGQYAFITSIVAIFVTIPHFGFKRILIREVAKNKDHAQEYLGSVLILRIALSVLAFLAIAITITFLDLSGKYITATYIIMASELVNVLSMSFIAIYFAFEKMEYNAILTGINRAIGLILIITVVYLDLGFLSLMVALFIPNIIVLALNYIFISKSNKKPIFKFNPKQWKYLMKESCPLFIELVFRQNFLRVDIFVLKAFRSATEISLFYAPYSLILRLQVIPVTLTTALFPSIARLADTSKASFEKTYIKAFKCLFILSLPIAISVTILADQIILIIFGEDFIKASITLKILIWMVNLMFLESLFNTVLVSIGKQGFAAVSHAVMFGINLVLDIILIPFYGFIGASIATIFAYIVRFILSYYFVSKHIITLPLGKILPKPILGGAAMGAVMLLLMDYNMIVAFSIGLVAYVGAIFFTGTFSMEEISSFKMALNISGKRLPR